MAYEHILFTEADGVATLTINRPAQLNALHLGVIAEMIEASLLIKTGNGPSTRLVVTAAGLAVLGANDSDQIDD